MRVNGYRLEVPGVVIGGLVFRAIMPSAVWTELSSAQLRYSEAEAVANDNRRPEVYAELARRIVLETHSD